MALAKDTQLPVHEGSYADHPVLTNVKIYEGAVVSVDANGFAKPYAGTDTFFAGIARKQADNTGGANGAIKVQVRRDVHHREVTLASAAQADVGDLLYASDDGTFTKTSTSNLLVGRIHAFVKANTIIARFEPSV